MMIRQKLFAILSKLKRICLSPIFRKLIALIVLAEFIFYIRCKYMIYYVNKYIPVSIVQPPFNKNRIETILKWAKTYSEYSTTSRVDKLIHIFGGECELNDLKRDNIRNLSRWGYFVKYDEETKATLTTKEIEWRDNFIEQTITNLEKDINYTFEKGYNPNIKPMSNTVPGQPIKSFYHPFLMYFYIWLFPKQFANFVFTYYLKFNHKYIKGLKVWYKLNKSMNIKDMEPILMFGGVSAANPMQCISFMDELMKRYKGNKNLFVIEVPWSEISIIHFIPYKGYVINNLPLSSEEMTNILFELEYMILNKSYNKLQLQWSCVGESYGTLMCSVIYQRIKDKELGIIPRLILVDAPTLCMTDPKAGRLGGVVEKDWRKYLFQICVAQEMMISVLMSRYSHWFEYCLYPHDFINDGCNKSHIIVSGTKDHLIPFETIKMGVEEANKLKNENEKEIKHVIMEGVPHGVWLVHKKYQNDVIDLL
eukprot:344558_1